MKSTLCQPGFSREGQILHDRMARAVGHKLRQERPEKRIAQMIRHLGQGFLHVRIAETGLHIRRWKGRCMRSDDLKPVGEMRTIRLAT